ncbi:fungal-specific transcription factor domain-containing protein [Geopyxis carbonaria]|nr:fungal-specific transcription factor domain-containing protein [Geopyxis carbonaria]
MVGGMPRSYVPDYSQTNIGSYGRPSDGADVENASRHLSLGDVGGPIPGGLDHSQLGLRDEDNFYFDFEIFDNSTDWLRDWGANGTTSPESHNGLDAMNDVLGVGLTPNLNTIEVPSLASATNSTNDVASPKSAPSDDGAGYNPRPPPPPGEIEHNVPGLPIVSPLREHNASADFLPWKWHAPREEASRTVTLPPLRLLLTECSGDKHSRYGGSSTPEGAPFNEAGTITEDIRKEMISVLSLPSIRPPYPLSDSESMDANFPSKEVIADFAKLYFKNFHPILPMIHRPTFCIDRCPSTLLIAMVSIGASYSSLKNAKHFADALSELCKRCLSWMAESNPEYARSAFYLQSLCLQNLYAMGSGSTSLYDAADVSRSILIGNSRRIGLFSGELSPSPSTPASAHESPSPHHTSSPHHPSSNSDPAHDISLDLESRWRAWREIESLKRLAWSIFEYDSSFSTLSNRRGAITLSDITIRIPCSESLWEAPTAQAWHTLLTTTESDTRGMPFYTTLQAIISSRFSPRLLTSWGKRICAQAMGRMMWDFKELEESVLTVSVGAARSFRPAKVKLLDSLMLVCDASSTQPGEVENDRFHWVLARLIAHYTHLHAAFPTVSRLLNLARKPPAPGREADDPRLRKIRGSFATHQVEARTIAYHAAQIIALSRWRPVFSPAEGMRLFLAGVVLWGFGNYYRPGAPSSSSSAGDGFSPGRQDAVVRLDLLPWHSGCGSPDAWIRTGAGKATIGMGGEGGQDRMMEVCGEGGAKEVLKVVVGILGSLRVWGLGGEFKRVLEELVRRRAEGER